MLKAGFCCLSLKTGALITGWFRLVLGIIHVVGVSIFYSTLKLEDADLNEDTIRKIHFLRFDIVLTALNIYGFISLIYGTYKGRAGFLVPYMWCSSVQLAEYIFLFFYWLWFCYSSKLHPLFLILGILPFVTLQYLFCLVGSYYMELRSEKHKIKTTVPVA